MTRPISDLDVPLPALEADIARAESDWPAIRRRIAAQQDQVRQLLNHTDTQPEEAS